MFLGAIFIVYVASLAVGYQEERVQQLWGRLGLYREGIIIHDLFMDESNFTQISCSHCSCLEITRSSVPTLKPNSFIQINYYYYYGIFLVDININKIMPGAFRKLDELKELDISKNNLRQVENGTFNELHHLAVLDLSYNNISNISHDVFCGLNKLSQLYLQNNKVVLLHDNLFVSQTNSLKLLNVSSNYLRQMGNTFQGLRLLTDLHLDNNIIATVPQSAFTGFKIIGHLYLQHNNITELQHNCFRGLTLENLDLSYNHLTTLIHESFQGLEGVKTLSMSYNNLTSLSQDCFQELTSLEYLDISHNNLTEFRYGLFSHLERLEYLNFSYNGFHEFPLLILSPLLSLRELRVASNNIKSLDIPKTLEHLRSLRSIDIDKNFNWSCSNLTNIVNKLYARDVMVIKGRHFSGDNVRGISCYKDDLVVTGKDETTEAVRVSAGSIEESIDEILNNLLQKCSSGTDVSDENKIPYNFNTSMINTIILTIIASGILTHIILLYYFIRYKLNRNKFSLENLELM